MQGPNTKNAADDEGAVQGQKSKSAPDSEGAVQRQTAKNATDDGEDRTGTKIEERTR